MGIEVKKYRLPEHWIGALFNDDYTGLSDEEEQEIRNFIERKGGWAVDVDLENKVFCPYNDANSIPDVCMDFIFHKIVND